jgi:hypothetical protein
MSKKIFDPKKYDTTTCPSATLMDLLKIQSVNVVESAGALGSL